MSSEMTREQVEQIAAHLHDRLSPASTMFPDLTRWLAHDASQREEIERLKRISTLAEREIEQICGKALNYLWYKDDQDNFPGTTKHDGVCVGEHVAATIAQELANRYIALKAEVDGVQR